MSVLVWNGAGQVDVWEFDEELKLAQKMMKGDTMAAIDWMVGRTRKCRL
jgi:hypothetical protein